MRRREFIWSLGCALGYFFTFLQVTLVVLGSMHAAQAEQTPYPIGLVSPGSASSMAPRVDALKKGLRDHGYVEGQNITIEYRWGDGKDELVPGLVSDLMNLKVDMFLTHGVLATRAAWDAALQSRSSASTAAISLPRAWLRAFHSQAATSPA